GALAPLVAEVSAWTRVGRAHQHEAGREGDASLRSCDADRSLLQRLAQRLECGTGELGELVEEEDAVLGEARLARAGHGPAADQPGAGDRVVRRAERAPGHQRA